MKYTLSVFAAVCSLGISSTGLHALEIGVSTPVGGASVSIGGHKDDDSGGGTLASVGVRVGGSGTGGGGTGGGGTGGGGTGGAGTGGGGSGGTGGAGGGGTGGGTDFAGTDNPGNQRFPSGDEIGVLQIVGTSVWTRDGALVGIVTGHGPRDANGLITVDVDVVSDFGLRHDLIKLRIRETAFDDGSLRITHDRQSFLALFI